MPGSHLGHMSTAAFLLVAFPPGTRLRTSVYPEHGQSPQQKEKAGTQWAPCPEATGSTSTFTGYSQAHQGETGVLPLGGAPGSKNEDAP